MPDPFGSGRAVSMTGSAVPMRDGAGLVCIRHANEEDIMRMSWPEVVTMLRHAARQRDGRAYVKDQTLVLTPTGPGEPITIRPVGSDDLHVEAGWITRMVVDREEHEHIEPAVLKAVEDIMDGHAEEVVIVGQDDSWVGVAFGISTSGKRIGDNDPRRQYYRTIPAWRR